MMMLVRKYQAAVWTPSLYSLQAFMCSNRFHFCRTRHNDAGLTATLEATEEAEGQSTPGRDGIEAAEGRRSAGQPSTSGRQAPGQEFVDLGVDDRLTVRFSMLCNARGMGLPPDLCRLVAVSILVYSNVRCGCHSLRPCLWSNHRCAVLWCRCGLRRWVCWSPLMCNKKLSQKH